MKPTANQLMGKQAKRIKKLFKSATSNKEKTILSLFDKSGVWSKPYKDAGYTVIQVDLAYGDDVFEIMVDATQQVAEGKQEGIKVNVYGILAAPPCTDFAGSGARWWKGKEKQPANYENKHTIGFKNTLEHSVAMVYCIEEIVAQLDPVFWVIENPVGRLGKLVPDIGKPWYFQPSDFGDLYTKKTGLWGKFNIPKKTPVLPLLGSIMQSKMGSKDKDKRSKTPAGFAKAFFEANQ